MRSGRAVDETSSPVSRSAMSVRLTRRLLFVLLVAGSGFAVSAALAHQSGCHSSHSCPSDHHSYVWVDAAGQGWDCAEPGAPEYVPSRDTSTITYGGSTY